MNREKLLVLLDNGHAQSTAGKRSPLFNEQMKKLYGMECFREYRYVRDIVSELMYQLPNKYGIKVYDITPEEIEDVKLTTRANRANSIINEVSKNGVKCIFISVHVNAAQNSGWSTATGWSVWTTKGKNESDKLADCLIEAAKDILLPLNKVVREDFSDGDGDYEENFTVLKKTNCPSILTENFFLDNVSDVEWLLSKLGMKSIVDIHILGILKYIKQI